MYCTHGGSQEIDLIIEREDGRILPVEVKFKTAIDDDDTKYLRWLRSKLGDQVLDLVVISNGPGAYRDHNGVAIVPAALLGP